MKEKMSVEQLKNSVCAYDLSVGQLMSKNVCKAHKTDSLRTISDEMERHRIHHIPVVDEQNHVIGLVSHRDLLRLSLSELSERDCNDATGWLENIKVEEMMKEAFFGEVDTIQVKTSLRTAAIEMIDKGYGCLPVVDHQGVLVGMLTTSDFVNFFTSECA